MLKTSNMKIGPADHATKTFEQKTTLFNALLKYVQANCKIFLKPIYYKIAKKSIFFILSFVLATYFVLTIILSLWDPNQYKSQICEYLANKTDHHIEIGCIHLSSFPSIVFKIENVKIKKTKNKKNSLVELKGINFSPRLRYLLLGKLNLRIHGTEIKWKKYYFPKLSTDVSLFKNTIELKSTRADFATDDPQKYLEIDFLRIYQDDKIPLYFLTHKCKDFDLKFLFSLLKTEINISGKADILVDLKTKGNSILELKKNLSGHLHFNSDNGKLNGFDLNASLKEAKSVVKTAASSLSSALARTYDSIIHRKQTKNTDFTSFHKLKFNATLDNGIIKADNILLHHSLYKVEARGIINLLSNSLNFIIEARYHGTHSNNTKKRKTSVPLKIAMSGPIENPNIKPDFSSYLQYLKD